MTTPTLAPIDQWPAELAELEGAFAGRLDVYRTMAHHPALLRAWTNLRQHVVLDSSLGPERSEVVILRAAVRLGSSYEWNHHLLRARALGMADARIGALRGPVDDIAGPDATLARAVDELTTDAQLSTETLTDLTEAVGPQGVLDLFATVGFYSTLAFIVKSFGTPLDTAVARDIEGHPLAEVAP